MSAEIVTASISAVSGIIVAAVGYYLTKKREREAQWRSEKLAYYKAFVSSMSYSLEGESSHEGHIAFAKACNDLLLFAPQSVIVALRALQDEIGQPIASRSREKHDALLSKLFIEMRKDLNVKPQDDPASFQIILLGSGVKIRGKSV